MRTQELALAALEAGEEYEGEYGQVVLVEPPGGMPAALGIGELAGLPGLSGTSFGATTPPGAPQYEGTGNKLFTDAS